MSRDPFKIDGPTCLSFSGGRTSAYMLWRVLQSNTLEDILRWLVVCFSNTGKEAEETLVFVDRCAVEWGVPIQWLEYRDNETGYALVDFAAASRDGEPFEALIRKKGYLPNPVTRFCTSELKIRPVYRWLRDSGRIGDGLDMLIGMRADEPERVAKIRAGRHSESVAIENMVPLADAGVSKQDVGAFWRSQPFDLELLTVNGRTLEGNCDLCFLKPPAQRMSLMAAKPKSPVWWIQMESLALALASKPSGARFTKDGPSYAELARFAADQRDMFDPDEEAIPCFCGD